MNSRAIWGILIAAVLAVSMSLTVYADISGSLTVVSASSDGVTHTMTVEDKIKQIPANKAPDLITFWAFAVPTSPADAAAGVALTVDALTIHHGVNDHQAFDAIACPPDKNPTCKAIKSTPVQSFHPHKAKFDGAFCVVGLESPKADFKAQHKTITMEASDTAFAVATGTIGERGECPIGLGITSLVTPPTALPIP